MPALEEILKVPSFLKYCECFCSVSMHFFLMISKAHASTGEREGKCRRGRGRAVVEMRRERREFGKRERVKEGNLIDHIFTKRDIQITKQTPH